MESTNVILITALQVIDIVLRINIFERHTPLAPCHLQQSGDLALVSWESWPCSLYTVALGRVGSAPFLGNIVELALVSGAKVSLLLGHDHVKGVSSIYLL